MQMQERRISFFLTESEWSRIRGSNALDPKYLLIIERAYQKCMRAGKQGEAAMLGIREISDLVGFPYTVNHHDSFNISLAHIKPGDIQFYNLGTRDKEVVFCFGVSRDRDAGG